MKWSRCKWVMWLVPALLGGVVALASADPARTKLLEVQAMKRGLPWLKMKSSTQSLKARLDQLRLKVLLPGAQLPPQPAAQAAVTVTVTLGAQVTAVPGAYVFANGVDLWAAASLPVESISPGIWYIPSGEFFILYSLAGTQGKDLVFECTGGFPASMNVQGYAISETQNPANIGGAPWLLFALSHIRTKLGVLRPAPSRRSSLCQSGRADQLFGERLDASRRRRSGFLFWPPVAGCLRRSGACIAPRASRVPYGSASMRSTESCGVWCPDCQTTCHLARVKPRMGCHGIRSRGSVWSLHLWKRILVEPLLDRLDKMGALRRSVRRLERDRFGVGRRYAIACCGQTTGNYQREFDRRRRGRATLAGLSASWRLEFQEV